MTQAERLKYLVKWFADGADIPADEDGMCRLLRSIMNMRMPRRLPDEVLKIHDEYLLQIARDKGIVAAADLPSIKEIFGSTAPGSDIISLWQGDITRLECGAIVNAANSAMLGCFVPMHGCIDNYIHSYAGVQLRAECLERMDELRSKYGDSYEQPTAVPMLTGAYNLPAKSVIHVVGPIVYGSLTEAHEVLLANCYKNILDMCCKNAIKTVAFCCISTGEFNFPGRRAAEVAVMSVSDWIKHNDGAMEKVVFDVFKDEDRRFYEELFAK